jgi:SAM-dependent methyltransferase
LYPGILQCPSCGFILADVHIPAVELQRLYQRNYFFGCECLNYLEHKAALQKNFRARTRTLLKYSSGGNLFEIGCAYGFFLELARHRGKAEGCDISTQACEEAQHKGCPVRCGDFLRLPLKKMTAMSSSCETRSGIPRGPIFMFKKPRHF